MEITCNKTPMHTSGDLPALGKAAPSFELTNTSLDSVTLDTFKDCPLLINVYPSLDTSVCFDSVKVFSEEVKGLDAYLLCVSKDLPFALKRIAEGENMTSLQLLSAFKTNDFGKAYGVLINDGPFQNLLARSVFVLDKSHNLIYAELVSDITNPPNYKKAIAALKGE